MELWWDELEYNERVVKDGRQHTYREKSLPYTREVQMINFDVKIKDWRRQSLNIEIALTDVEDIVIVFQKGLNI